ncbi:MAG: tetratricopeptide repeat protein, partial [Deltaproteobacteria bacterium]|nr:tetratricopeptide repeat protein [Deltaproteobacteria bacterium]
EEAVAALERAIELDPEAPRVHFDLALAYLARDELFWAAEELELAEQAAPEDLRVAFERGRVLLQLEELEAARELLSKAAADPELAPRARYYLGIALAKSGETDAARVELTRVVEHAPGTSHAEAAVSVVEELLQREWDLLPLFTGFVSVGGQYDSNVILEPDDAERRPGSDAGGLVLRGALTLAPVSTPAHLLFGTLNASRTFHFADPADQFSLTAAGGTVGYRYRFAAEGLTHALQVSYRYDLGFLDGGSLTDDPDFYAWREAHGGSFRWSLDEGDRWSTFLDANYRYATFADMRRDAHVLSGRVGQNMAFVDQRLKLLVSLGGRFDDARGRGYDLWGLDATVALSALGPWELEFLGLLRCEHQDHFDSTYYSGWGTGRVDDSLTSTIAVGRMVWEFLGVEISWSHTEHFSTTMTFDYSRDLASLAVKAVFR